MREHTLFIHRPRIGLVMKRICPVRYDDVAQSPNRDHTLLQMKCLILAGDDRCYLLIARGDVAAR